MRLKKSDVFYLKYRGEDVQRVGLVKSVDESSNDNRYRIAWQTMGMKTYPYSQKDVNNWINHHTFYLI